MESQCGYTFRDDESELNIQILPNRMICERLASRDSEHSKPHPIFGKFVHPNQPRVSTILSRLIVQTNHPSYP